MFERITAELDDIAGVLQKRGDLRLAAAIDTVSNELDQLVERARRASARRAIDNAKLIQRSGGELPPGSEATNETLNEDKFDAYDSGYKKTVTPVGKRSVSDAIGRSLKDEAGKLDIATRDRVTIQARRKADAPTDEPKPVDEYTTRGMDGADKDALDDGNPATDLQFWGFEPAGTLHQPKSGESETGALDDPGGDREATRRAANLAREILRQASVVVEPATEVNNDEPPYDGDGYVKNDGGGEPGQGIYGADGLDDLD